MERTFFQDPAIRVGEVALKVQDLEKSKTFYTSILGLKVIEEDKTRVVLSSDGITPLVRIEQPELIEPKDRREAGLYHFAILLPNRKDLATFIYHLSENGIRLGAADHLVSEALYFDDPDGNGIEVYHDRPTHQWKREDQQIVMTVEPLDGDSILSELNGEKWKGMPEETVIGHIHLHVRDLQAAKDFYCKGLGFQTTFDQLDKALFISTAGYHHHIGLNTWKGEKAESPSTNRVGLQHYSLIFPGLEARQEAIYRLESLGYRVNEDRMLIHDPTGNVIKLDVK
ncbi:VOC family protein [Pontibacillus chungwhensis]|uniref:VOC family protein n=2 Tax=Pontibacillus TaxID=289201 RepID=A0ABY8UUG6_9BACI|nr:MULTISPECIES: VOC family protein [Pontibacillus]MCD5323306.1 VOC family protein [Pontibacillus sp. HN14]WIF96687.1 VOC family protein [Pontibacillus chungwhensis]